jgi:hypothetical protein
MPLRASCCDVRAPRMLLSPHTCRTLTLLAPLQSSPVPRLLPAPIMPMIGIVVSQSPPLGVLHSAVVFAHVEAGAIR